MPSGESFRVGDWLVQPSLNRLSRGGKTAALQPRFMDLLVFMAERPGKVVSKDEILAAVWAREFVSEGTLTHAVAIIRQTLGDDVRSPQYIETIPTRGYRLVAPVAPAEGSDPGTNETARRSATKPRRILVPLAVAFAGIVAAGVVSRILPIGRPRAAVAGAGRIVVLPFQNLGPTAREFIASGITDDITTRLAGAHSVDVVSRTSAIHCAKAGRSVREIKEELGADYIVEGTVHTEAGQTAESSVRVNVLLIRASDDTSLWAASYSSDLAYLADVGAAIAGRVLQELGIKVEKPELARLEARPTDDPDAYQAYLCGIRYHDLATREQLGLAVAMFERATTLDPSFALAWADLALTNSRIYHLRIDDSPERLARAQHAAERALSLAPELPEAHLALGCFHHLGQRDYERALHEYAVAARGLPNNSLLFALTADVHRRQGKWSEARAEIERVVTLDPQNYTAQLALGDTLRPLRAYEEADRAYRRAANLNPDRNEPYLRRFWNLVAWEGNTERARTVLLEAPLQGDPEVVYAQSYVSYLARDPRGALETLSTAPDDARMGSFRFAAKQVTQCIYYDALNDRAGVERWCGAALTALEGAASQRPADPQLLLEIGRAEVLLGRRAEGVATAERAVELGPVARDAYEGPGYLLQQAGILARAGETGKAVALVEHLLAVPSPLSVAWLRFDPQFDRLRDTPAFKTLLAEGPKPP